MGEIRPNQTSWQRLNCEKQVFQCYSKLTYDFRHGPKSIFHIKTLPKHIGNSRMNIWREGKNSERAIIAPPIRNRVKQNIAVVQDRTDLHNRAFIQ